MSEQWLADLEKARKTAVDLARDAGAKGDKKPDAAARRSALWRGSLAQLRQDVSHLERGLMTISQNPLAYNVTKKELTRRGDLLAQFSQQVEDLQSAMRSGAMSKRSGNGEVPWRDKASASSEQPRSFDEEVAGQDEALDMLHGTVKNLKRMGGEMSAEVNAHNEMLEELEDFTDDCTTQMRQQQVKLDKIRQGNATCYLWSYIACMSVVLFVLVVFF